MKRKLSEVPDCKEALEKTAQDIYDAGYAGGYLDGKKAIEDGHYELGYRQGLGELWDAVKKIFLTSSGNLEMNQIFGNDFYYNKNNILIKYSPEEVLKKIETYEKNQKKKENVPCDEYQIGDEVINIETGKKGVVINVYDDDTKFYRICVWAKGIKQPQFNPTKWKKTGNNFIFIKEFWDTLEDWSDEDV